jgi:hypothetical protein
VVRLPVVSTLDQSPLAGVEATLFRKIDVAGSLPLSAPSVSDANGMIDLSVEAGFEGYVTLVHADLAPSLYFFNPPIEKDVTVSPVRLATPSTVTALFQNVGRNFDPTRGVVVLTVEDCRSKPLAGVSFVVKGVEGSTNFYSVGGLPTITTSATDISGYGGLLNLPPTTTAIRADHAKLGTIGQLSLFVKAGTLSYSRMVPRAE